MADLNALKDSLSELTLKEAAELVKTLEEEWGVSAAAPVAMVAAAGEGDGGAAEAEQTEFDVHLSSAGDRKIQVIKEVRTITALGLKESKAVVDAAPGPVKEKVSREEAEKIKAQLEEAGAVVEIK